MKKCLSVMALILFIGIALSCQKQDVNRNERPMASVEADVAAIKALIAEWVDLYNAEDFQKMISVLYADNAILMTPNAPVRRTRDAILLSYQKESERDLQHVDASVAEDVRVCGDLALAWGMDTGTTTPRGGGEPVKYSVKWLMTFERQPDGAWKCLYEMWNDNNPAADRL